MRLKEVELHHIFYRSHPKWTFEQNVRASSLSLGVSEKGIIRILRAYEIDKENLLWYLRVLKEDMDAVYEEELKWAEKIRSKTLTKKEKKMFWKQHSIIDARSKFRTFSSPEEDLIPHSNPLLTDETCLAPKSKDVTQEIFWKAGKGGYVSPFGSPFNMQPMAPCFNPINIKSETNTI